MASRGFGVTDARILQFCLDGDWKKDGQNLIYTPRVISETEIDRFLRKEKLITTDHRVQIRAHLDRLVEEGWLYKAENNYMYIQIELLEMSMLLLFIATYDPERVNALMSNSTFKQSWKLFRDSLFFNIDPFTQKFEPENQEKSVKIVIKKPPSGSENIEKILLNKNRKKTIEETIKSLEHENKEFRYYLLADPFANKEVCDIFSNISFRHKLETIDPLMSRSRYSDRRLKSKLLRLAWRLKLYKVGIRLKSDLDLWKLTSVSYNEWSDPILSALEKKYLSSKRFAVFLSSLIVSGAMYRYHLFHKDSKLILSFSYRAIFTEMLLTHPVNLLTLLEKVLPKDYIEDINFVNYLSRIHVKPDSSKNEWQPVYALPYSNHGGLPSGHPGSYPLIALALLIHGSIECDENLSVLSEAIGDEEIKKIEQNSFPEKELYEKGLEYYFSLKDFIFKQELPSIEQELQARTDKVVKISKRIKNIVESDKTSESESTLKELLTEINLIRFLNDLENLWQSDPEYEV